MELGTWRFQQKFSEKCFAFFVTVSSSFVHLLNIIDRSGHTTTEEAIFYVFNAKSDVAHEFQDYLSPNSSQVPHPDVLAAVVLVNKFSYALYCHFFPEGRKLSSVSFKAKGISISNSQVQLLHLLNNKNAQGIEIANLVGTRQLILYQLTFNHPICLLPE